MKNKIIFTGLLLCACFIQCAAQTTTPRSTSVQTHAWLVLNGNVTLNKWVGFYDFQFRRADLVSEWQQLLLRGAILYKFRPDLVAGAGYGFVNTWPYGQFPVSAVTKENRIFEQVQFNQSLGKSLMNWRLRAEQRWIGTQKRFENRFRVMARLRMPLTKGEQLRLYAVVYDELFVNAGKNVSYNLFDQNRLGASIGYAFNKTTFAELGYMNQFVQQRNFIAGTTTLPVESNHTLMLTFTKNVELNLHKN